MLPVGRRTVIVGAGAGGLAVAAELTRRNLEFELLERSDAIGSAWRRRYDSLRLHTGRQFSGLPGLPIPRRYGRWVARDDLVEYLEDYAAHFGIQPSFRVELEGLERTGDRLAGAHLGPDVRGRCVVLATGMCHTPQIPPLPGLASFPGAVLHSADYREPSPYRGQQVLVLGAGNSATEIATELGKVAEVSLSVRRPPNIVRRDIAGFPTQAVRHRPAPGARAGRQRPYDHVAPDQPARSRRVRPARPVGRRLQPVSADPDRADPGPRFRGAVQAGRITVVPPIASIDGPDVRLADDRAIRPGRDHRRHRVPVGPGDLVGQSGVLDDRGRPKIGGGRTAPDAPDLYLVGLTVVLSGLLREVGIQAREVGRAIARESLLAWAPAR